MRNQIPLHRQTARIYRMRLHSPARQMRHDGSNHQRNKQRISSRNLRNQEHRRQRRIHHSGHDTRHPCQDKIADRHRSYAGKINQSCHQIAPNAPGKQTGGKNTAYSPAPVRQSRRYHLHKKQSYDIQNNHKSTAFKIEEIGIF